MTGTRVLFVYNADGGVLNALRDVWHRVTSPSTYPCALCKVTYGVTGMDRKWRQFTASLDLPVAFLHRDELTAELRDHQGGAFELPAVLIEDRHGVAELVRADELRRARSVDDLITTVEAALAARAP